MQFKFSPQPEPKVAGRAAGQFSPGNHNYHPQSGGSSPVQHALPAPFPTEYPTTTAAGGGISRSRAQLDVGGVGGAAGGEAGAFSLEGRHSTSYGYGQQAAVDHRDLRRELTRVSPPRNTGGGAYGGLVGGTQTRFGGGRRTSSPEGLHHVRSQVNSVEKQLARDEAQIAALSAEVERLKHQQQREAHELNPITERLPQPVRHKNYSNSSHNNTTSRNQGGAAAVSSEHDRSNISLASGSRHGGPTPSSGKLSGIVSSNRSVVTEMRENFREEQEREQRSNSRHQQENHENRTFSYNDAEILAIKARLKLKEDEALSQELLLHELRREVDVLKSKTQQTSFTAEEAEDEVIKLKGMNASLTKSLAESQSRYNKLHADYEDTASMADEMAKHIKHLTVEVDQQRKEISQLKKANSRTMRDSGLDSSTFGPEAVQHTKNQQTSSSSRHVSPLRDGMQDPGGREYQAEKAKLRYRRQQELRLVQDIADKEGIDLERAAARLNATLDRRISPSKYHQDRDGGDGRGALEIATATDSDDMPMAADDDDDDDDDDDLPGLNPHSQPYNYQGGNNNSSSNSNNNNNAGPYSLPAQTYNNNGSPNRSYGAGAAGGRSPQQQTTTVHYDGRFPWGSDGRSGSAQGPVASGAASVTFDGTTGGGQQKSGHALADFLRRNPTPHNTKTLAAANGDNNNTSGNTSATLHHQHQQGGQHNGSGIVEAPSNVTPAALEALSDAEHASQVL